MLLLSNMISTRLSFGQHLLNLLLIGQQTPSGVCCVFQDTASMTTRAVIVGHLQQGSRHGEFGTAMVNDISEHPTSR